MVGRGFTPSRAPDQSTNREHRKAKQGVRCSSCIVTFSFGGRGMKSQWIAASMALVFAGPVLANDAPKSPAARKQTCSGFASPAIRVAYSSVGMAPCCDAGLACAQYLSTTIIPKPKAAHRT